MEREPKMSTTLRPLSYTLLLSVVVLLAWRFAWSQKSANTGLIVVVRPDASMTVEMVQHHDTATSDRTTRWFRVNLAVRLNSGSRVSLFLKHVAGSPGFEQQSLSHLKYFVQLPGTPSPTPWQIRTPAPLFTTQRNGNFSLLIGLTSESTPHEWDLSADSIGLILTSSDGLLKIYRTVPLSINVVGSDTSKLGNN